MGGSCRALQGASLRLLGLRGCPEWGASATRPGRRGAARGRRGGPGRGMRPGPPPAPGRLSAASRTARADRGRGGGGAQGGRAAGPSAAQCFGYRQPPPGCPGPRAAPPPATPAAPGGGRSVPGRGNRSRRREQRAGALGARMLGERRRPGPGTPKGKSGREDWTRRRCDTWWDAGSVGVAVGSLWGWNAPPPSTWGPSG